MSQEPRSSDQAATPEGHTAEKPAISELGQPGTPGAGMSAAVPHAADADPANDHEVDHGHAEAALGPIDWGTWAYALVGGLAGAVVIFAFWMALN